MAATGIATAAGVTGNDINAGLCSGSNIEFTNSPSNDKCKTSDANDTANNLAKTIINILSIVVGIVAVIMIIIGGFRYITSGGKQETVTAAKNTILYAVIGLVIVALAQLIVHFILNKTSSANVEANR